MADFSATDAALEGFQLTREKPRAVAVWAALMLVANLVTTGVLVSLGGEAFSAVMQGEAGADPEQAMENLRALGPLYLLLAPLAVLFSATLTAAIYRAVLRREEGGPGYLRFGGDEVRLALTMVLLALLLIGVVLLGGIVLAILAGMLAAAGGEGGAAGVGLLGSLVFAGAVFFLLVRLSLALPATFAERRIRIWASWRLTKGRFWALLGMFVLAIILALVIYLLAMMIYLGVAALIGGGIAAASSVFQPDYSSFGELVTAPFVLFTLVSAIVGAVTTAITAAPAMAAYRDITGHGPGGEAAG